MPSGKVHDAITVACAVVGAAGGVYLGYSPRVVAVYAISTLISGLILSPDLDLDSTPYERWGIFRFLWWPYKVLLPHRSIISHGPIIAAPIRLAYFAFSSLLFWSLASYAYVGQWQGREADFGQIGADAATAVYDWLKATPRAYLYTAYFGIEVGAESHIIADAIYSRWRKK